MLKKIVQMKLRFFAQALLAKYKPKVIGITGSVGKTSAKEAVYAVLKDKYRTRKSIKNYNNELGLPLTIIGQSSAGKSVLGWWLIFLKAFWLLVLKNKNYPEVLVLEMGVDKPGDMDYLLDIVKPDIGVVTMIGPSHLESFGEISKIREEKGRLISGLKKNGLAVLNADNEDCLKIKKNNDSKLLTYGFNKDSEVWAHDFSLKYKDLKSIEGISGTVYKLTYQGSTVPILLPGVIGKPAVYASLVAACVGLYFKMSLVEIANALESYDPAEGRMRLISGIKGTLLIDDTYNASPQSSLAAIDLVNRIRIRSKFKKIAVFGDMLELGRMSVSGHMEVGKALQEAGFDMIVAVGERARDILRGAKEAGMKDNQLFHFDKNHPAGKFVQKKMKAGDLILIKGSQGARMEQVVKEVMAEPLRAGELLVRQDEGWL